MKTRQRLWNTLLAGVVACVPLLVGAHADTSAMIKDCDDCHGKGGVSEFSDMPTITGMSALAHADALYVYRDAARPCASSRYRHGDTARAEKTMCDVAKTMSDDEIEEIAAYYANKPFVAAKQAFDATLVARGQAVHDELCEKCHTEGGSVAADDAGILAGQHSDYLRQSFADYNSGKRDQTKKMKDKMDKVDPADVEALIAYYASLQ